MSNRTAKYEGKVQLHTALQPAVQYKLRRALAKDAGHCRHRGAASKCCEHGG